MGKGGGNHHLRKSQETTLNCLYSSYFFEFKWLRFNLSQIQWWRLISKLVRLNGFHIYIYNYSHSPFFIKLITPYVL
ncbi:hypothetical protein Hanom_Chr09g00816881 [Helianthus anomalus]